MSFSNTKTPLKPKAKPKYVLPIEGPYHKQVLEGKNKEEFIRLFPITMNPDMMRLFGMCHSTLHRFAKELGLQKNRDVILKKHSRQVKKICEQNGYYESLKGHRPSAQCREASRQKLLSGWHPMKVLKAKHPTIYKRRMKERSEKRKELHRRERRRVELGLDPLTNISTPTRIYTRSQTMHRFGAKKRGYILGDRHEDSGCRMSIYYNDETERCPRFEQNCIADGFYVEHIRYKGL